MSHRRMDVTELYEFLMGTGPKKVLFVVFSSYTECFRSSYTVCRIVDCRYVFRPVVEGSTSRGFEYDLYIGQCRFEFYE